MKDNNEIHKITNHDTRIYIIYRNIFLIPNEIQSFNKTKTFHTGKSVGYFKRTTEILFTFKN